MSDESKEGLSGLCPFRGAQPCEATPCALKDETGVCAFLIIAKGLGERNG
jgi:hypothetical protein